MECNINKKGEIQVLDSKKVTKTPETVNKEYCRYFDNDELMDKLSDVTNAQHRMLLMFLYMTGVRITECVNLTKKDIDFKNAVMTVKWLKSRKYKQRIVPLHPQILSVLGMYVAPMNLDTKIFPITRQFAWKICKRWLNTNPHTLRHSFAVNFLRQGGDIIYLHRLLGHSQIQTTMEYLKIVPTDQGKELLKVKY